MPAGFRIESGEDIFSVIRECDRVVHDPCQSFQPAIDLLKAAAHDPEVLAIKMTLYRAGRNAPVVQALLEAVRTGNRSRSWWN